MHRFTRPHGQSLTAESTLSEVLPQELSRVLPAVTEIGIETLEDLYECIASTGGNWYRNFQGISRDLALATVTWLAQNSEDVGEVTDRFYPPGFAPSDIAQKEYEKSLEKVPSVEVTGEIKGEVVSEITEVSPLPVIIEPESTADSDGCLINVTLSGELSGTNGENRAYEKGSLAAANDLEAVSMWLKAKATNPNTRSQYRKEAERFVLWCTMERGKALSSVGADDAALYSPWLEELGRTEPEDWAAKWKVPQNIWIGFKNAPRLSARWRPYNGPLTVSSRKTAITVVRLLFNFLVKTGYLRFNPFDQVSSKVHFLAGESAPREFADRSLTQRQWDTVLQCLHEMPDGEVRSRIEVILSLGKGLGMRASEMINARTGWICMRRIGDEDMRVIEIVGKGDKVRRLPVPDETAAVIDHYLELRGLSGLDSVEKDVPLLSSLLKDTKKGSRPAGLSRSGLYRALEGFFESAAALAEGTSAADAAKLRAGSTHWLRHTFATTALRQMSVNIVQNAMGHASIGTTSRYLTPEETEIAQAMKKIRPI